MNMAHFGRDKYSVIRSKKKFWVKFWNKENSAIGFRKVQRNFREM